MALMGVSKPLQTWPKGGVGAATAGAAGAAAAGCTAEAGVLPRLRLVAMAATKVAAVAHHNNGSSRQDHARGSGRRGSGASVVASYGDRRRKKLEELTGGAHEGPGVA